MTGQYIYHTYPFPFSIALIKSGYYAGGLYYYMEADQFVSEGTLEAYNLLLFKDWNPGSFPLHNCESCEKDCGNVKCTHTCCDYEPMSGLDVVINFPQKIPERPLVGASMTMDYQYDPCSYFDSPLGKPIKIIIGDLKLSRFNFITRLFRGRV
jgi:hypothetical protein